MKNLKRLGVVIALTLVLGAPTFAGETPTGPCAQPEPGETHGPPCAAAQMSDDSGAPGVTQTPPASDAVIIVSAVDVALNLLLIF